MADISRGFLILSDFREFLGQLLWSNFTLFNTFLFHILYIKTSLFNNHMALLLLIELYCKVYMFVMISIDKEYANDQ